MTLAEKLEYSYIEGQPSKLTFKEMHILTKKQRFLSLLMFFFMSAYTLFSKIVLKKDFANIAFLFVVLNLLTLAILKFISKSIVGLNHPIIYKIIVFLNKICKLVIFVLAIIGYFTFFNTYLSENYSITLVEYMSLLNSDFETASDIFCELFKKDVRLLSFIITVVLFIPNAIYFIVFSIKWYFITYVIMLLLCLPIVNLIIYIVWLSKNNNTFKHYYIYNNEYVIRENRVIDKHGYKFIKFLKKFLFTIPVVLFIYFAYYINFFVD